MCVDSDYRNYRICLLGSYLLAMDAIVNELIGFNMCALLDLRTRSRLCITVSTVEKGVQIAYLHSTGKFYS